MPIVCWADPIALQWNSEHSLASAVQALGRDADGGCPKAAEILAEQTAAEKQSGGPKANGLQAVSGGASNGPVKGAGALDQHQRALHRMDSPDGEGGTSGDSHCSDFVMH